MAFISVKDFASGLAAKLRTFLVNTDENVTVHGLVDSANGEILGTKTDDKATQTNTTPVSMMSVFKQISASVQALVTAFGAALTRNTGAADSNTLRVTIASGDQTAQVADNADGVAASASLLNIPVVAKLFGWNGTTYDRLQVDGNKNLRVASQASAVGGKDVYRNVDLDEADQQIKGTAASLHGGWYTNTAASTRWLHFYDALAANVTVGTTTPKITIGVPGNSSDDIAASLQAGESGLAFTTALTIACTTNPDGTGAPATGDMIVNVFYK